MRALPQDAALIIVDVQKGLDDAKYGRRNNPQAEANIARLLEAWRGTCRPIFHIQHLSREADSPLRPGQSGAEIKEVVKPLADEPVIQKSVNNAFVGTDLEKRLRQSGYDTLIITGLTTDHCVSTTARMAGDLGFNTFVVSDATATFGRVGPDGKLNDADAVHSISLATLHGEFATITDTESLLKQIE
ncbi:MAG: cysteine hydrolase family protein [Blastocatellia bacterium]